MARLIDFSGGQRQQPLGGNLIRSLQLKQILEQSRNRPQIQSIGEGFANLGTDLINDLRLRRLKEREDAEKAQRLEAAKQFGLSVFGGKQPAGGSPFLGGDQQGDKLSNKLVQEPTAGEFGDLPEKRALKDAFSQKQIQGPSSPTGEPLSLSQRLESFNGVGSQRPLNLPANLPLLSDQGSSQNLPLIIPDSVPRKQQPSNPRLDQFNSLLNIDPNAALNFAVRNDPRRQQQGSAFSKPAIKDFTRESIGAFQRSGNPADLKRAPSAPSSQITAALIPTLLGGINFDDPAELVRGLRSVQAASSALSGGDQAKLNEVLEIIQKNQAAVTPAPQEEPGLLSKGLNFAKQQGNQLKNFLTEQFQNGIPEPKAIQDFFNKQGGFDSRKLTDRLFDNSGQGGLQSPFSILHGVGEQFLLPGARNKQAPIQTPVRNQQNQQGADSVSAEDFEVFLDIPGATVDEEGFFFVPDSRAENGKRFLKDKPGNNGEKIRSSRFR